MDTKLGCAVTWRCLPSLGKVILSMWVLLTILTSNGASFVGSKCNPTARSFQEDAISYYVKSLRGAAIAATVRGESKRFKRYARFHYQAVQFRRLRDFKSASLMYRKFIEKVAAKSDVTEDAVLPAVAVAHASLNLALSEESQHCFDEARQVFKRGYKLVKELMRRDCIVHDFYLENSGKPQVAQAWLATLLTAWALLETKCWRVNAGRKLAKRADALDKSKARVLRWKMFDA